MILRVQRLNAQARLPEKGHASDAGFDLFSVEDKAIPSGESKLIATGIVLSVPEGHCLIVKDRSSKALKGLSTRAGVIDQGYTGEIFVLLRNESDRMYHVRQGEKIAQALLIPVPYCQVIEVDSVSVTERGQNGFGSTGE